MCNSRIHVKQSKTIATKERGTRKKLVWWSGFLAPTTALHILSFLPWTCKGDCLRPLVLPCPSILCRGKKEFTLITVIWTVLLVLLIDVSSFVFYFFLFSTLLFHLSHCSSPSKSTPETIFRTKRMQSFLILGRLLEAYLFERCYLSTRSSISMNKTGDEEKVMLPVKMNEGRRRRDHVLARDGVLLSHVCLSTSLTCKKWERIKNQ